MNMKHIATSVIFILIFSVSPTHAQFAYGDHWYDNPLGFSPINLHTSMGFILPAAAVGTCLALTGSDTTLRDKLSVYNESGFSWGYKYPHTFLAQNNTGINVQLRRWMSVGIELDVYVPKDGYNSTIGIAIRPFARFYPINTDTWRLYFESGGGLVYFVDNFPKPTEQDNRLGTLWNGTTKYGIGSEINFSSHTSLLLGIRHLHISNGNTQGVERNPSHDSNGLFIGFSHRIEK